MTRWVGRSLRRFEDPALVQGRGGFVADIAASSDTSFLRFVRAPVRDASLTGAKGLGEGEAIGAPAALIDVICDALSPFDVEIFEIPATPQPIRSLIRKAEGRR
jgi:CO/xanthine dehydrogenase Mo-binding subunit